MSKPSTPSARPTTGSTTSALGSPKAKILLNTESSSPPDLEPDTYPCYLCFRILPSSKFRDDQSCGYNSHGGLNAHDRFCLLCGLMHGLYLPRDSVTYQGQEQYVCDACEGFCGIFEWKYGCRPMKVHHLLRKNYTAADLEHSRGYNHWQSRRGIDGGLNPVLPMPKGNAQGLDHDSAYLPFPQKIGMHPIRWARERKYDEPSELSIMRMRSTVKYGAAIYQKPRRMARLYSMHAFRTSRAYVAKHIINTQPSSPLNATTVTAARARSRRNRDNQ